MIRAALYLVGFGLVSSPAVWSQTTTRISVDSAGGQADSASYTFPSLSADGRYVAFYSNADNLVPGDANGTWDVVVKDRQTGTTTLVSVDSNGNHANDYTSNAVISADGRYVAYDGVASNLVPGDTNGFLDVFVHDRVLGTTVRVSVDSDGFQGNWESFKPVISGDGRYVAFASRSSNLVPNDTNFDWDVFVHDMQTGSTTRVSVDSAGGQSNGSSTAAAISADGRYVAFHSTASNLVPGDTNNTYDVFVHDMATGVTDRVSLDSAGAQANNNSMGASISADGRYVAFQSQATNLVPGDTNNAADLFVHDRVTGATIRASVDSSGAQANAYSFWPILSADGRFVSFHSLATDLVPGDTNGKLDVFVRDLRLGTTSRVSVDSAGAQADGDSSTSSISADGRFVAYFSYATNLVSGDTNGTTDVFVYDRGAEAALLPFCFGDGSGATCPCSNPGSSGHGCENSFATGGALLAASGAAGLANDSVVLTATGELPTALSIVLQGDSFLAGVGFGDGVRCAGGSLKRLFVKHAVGGSVSAPQPGDPSISARSASLGDPIQLGTSRVYQTYYRDSSLGFCAFGFNVTNAIAVAWGD
jgi:archaellum component FlaF (FlaF/FlaG flagellin family)